MNDHAVNLDYFLYSCFEFEKLCKHIPKKLHSDQRWPAAREFIEGDNSSLAGKDVESSLAEILNWYATQFPKLTTLKTLTMSEVSAVVEPIVMISRDIALVHENAKGEVLIFSPGSPSTTWQTLSKAVTEKFSHLASLIGAFLEWHFKEDVTEVIEPGSRPPVGRFAPRRYFASKDSGGGRSRDGGGRRDGGRGRDGGGRNARGRAGREDPTTKDPAKEREAIKEVLKAIQTLNSDNNLEEIALPPANSYYRRIQHRQAADEGLASRSAGDEPDRHVIVMRSKLEEEETP